MVVDAVVLLGVAWLEGEDAHLRRRENFEIILVFAGLRRELHSVCGAFEQVLSDSWSDLEPDVASAVVECLLHIDIVLIIHESHFAKAVSFQRAGVDANFFFFCFWLGL